MKAAGKQDGSGCGSFERLKMDLRGTKSMPLVLHTKGKRIRPHGSGPEVIGLIVVKRLLLNLNSHANTFRPEAVAYSEFHYQYTCYLE